MCGPLPQEPPHTELALQQLEALHREYDLYVWLSFRMGAAFPDQQLVEAWRMQCSDLIRQGLDNLGPRGSRCICSAYCIASRPSHPQRWVLQVRELVKECSSVCVKG